MQVNLSDIQSSVPIDKNISVYSKIGFCNQDYRKKKYFTFKNILFIYLFIYIKILNNFYIYFLLSLKKKLAFRIQASGHPSIISPEQVGAEVSYKLIYFISF
jgi:hypothetical protein